LAQVSRRAGLDENKLSPGQGRNCVASARTRPARGATGNVALVRETTRETWGWAALERTARDAQRIAPVAQIARFTVTAIAVLALGIGATTAIFSVVNGTAPPYPSRAGRSGDGLGTAAIRSSQRDPTQNFLDWRARNRSFSEISAIYRISESGGGWRAGADSGMRMLLDFRILRVARCSDAPSRPLTMCQRLV
jgi:hypothetical protein